MSASKDGPVGSQERSCLVTLLDAVMAEAKKLPTKPKWAPASCGATKSTGRPRLRDRVRLGGASPQRGGIVQVTADDAGALGRESLLGLVGSGQAGGPVARRDEFVDNGGSDPTGRSSDKCTHELVLLRAGGERALITRPAPSQVA